MLIQEPETQSPVLVEDVHLLAADQALVKACLRADAASQRKFIERFQGDVYRVCCRILSSTHDSEDVAQETFIRALKSLHRWDGNRPLRPWVLMIAVNRCRTKLGQRKRTQGPEMLATIPAKEEQAELHNDLLLHLRKAVDDLRDEYREVFILFHDQELPYEAIGQIMGKPVGTIKTWLHRAREALLKCLKAKGLTLENGT